MKVLVSSSGQAMHSKLDPRFGRAEFFAVVDTETGQFEVVRNDQGREAAQGAGIQAAELAARLGVKVVITGHCGPKAWSALSAAGIAVVSGAQGTVAQAVDDYKKGLLKAASAPDVKGHWA